MNQCRCFHFLIGGSSTLRADRGEEFGGRPGSLERRIVAGWTARKLGRGLYVPSETRAGEGVPGNNSPGSARALHLVGSVQSGTGNGQTKRWCRKVNQ